MSAMMEAVARASLVMLRPLVVASQDPARFRQLCQNLGYDPAVNAAELAKVAWLSDVVNLLEQAEDLLTDLRGDRTNLPTTVLNLIELLQDIWSQLSEPAPLVNGSSVAEFTNRQFWADLVTDLPTFLLVNYLDQNHATISGLLHLAGVIEVDSEAAKADAYSGTLRRPHTRLTLELDQLGHLLSDPAKHLQDRVGWGDAFDHTSLLRQLYSVLRRFGLRTRRPPIDPRFVGPAGLIAETHPDRHSLRGLAVPFVHGRLPGGNGFVDLGLLIVPIPSRSASGPVDGLYVTVLADEGFSIEVSLAPNWTLGLSAEMSATGATGVKIFPPGLTSWGTEPNSEVTLSITGSPPKPWRLIGSPGGTRIEVDGFELALMLGLDELLLSARTVSASGSTGALRLVIAPGETDNFLQSLLGQAEITAEVDVDIQWSGSHGFTFNGSSSLSVRIPLNLSLGPISLTDLELAAATISSGATELGARVSIGAELGPFAVDVDRIGVGLTLYRAATGAGTVGSLDVRVGLLPPTSLGFTVDIEGVVIGGGFVSHDPALGRYAGALALDFLTVGLAAVVVVDTQLPGNPDGWALFASVSLTFPSLPLGFGFFLSGVGGIVCLNRTMDTEALAAGLREGAIDALLFPDDPLVDAPLIIAQLDAWFPQAEGSTVFGVAVTITWGTPKALITGELGVMLSFPDLDLALVGSITMALPDEEHTLLELHMDTLGTVDVAAATVLVVASLYDSALLGTIQLSGDMAMYSQFGAEPYFLLSVGGYHPNFHPPGYLPASVLDLRRMGCELTLSEDVWFKLENYVAVTSNTLQFGAQATLEASVRVLGVTYVATGKVGFDVLLVFSPFSFAADLYASVTVSAKDTELLAVSLSAHMEGPQPWYLSGSARFEFLGIGVRFDILVGASANVQAPPRVNVLDAVVAALAIPDAWRPVAPAGQTVLLTTDTEADGSIVRVRPDAGLEAVQTAAPLERTLDVYGIYAITGPKTLHIEDAGITDANGVTWETVTDWFAPAVYDQMNRIDKIAAPSYEQMSAGVRLSADGVSFGNDTQSVTPDYEVRVLNEETTQPLGIQPLIGMLTSVTAGLVLDRLRHQGLPRTVTGAQPFTIAAPAWTLIDATTGIAAGAPATYPTVLGQLHNRTTKDPTTRRRLRMAPVYATREAI